MKQEYLTKLENLKERGNYGGISYREGSPKGNTNIAIQKCQDLFTEMFGEDIELKINGEVEKRTLSVMELENELAQVSDSFKSIGERTFEDIVTIKALIKAERMKRTR